MIATIASATFNRSHLSAASAGLFGGGGSENQCRSGMYLIDFDKSQVDILCPPSHTHDTARGRLTRRKTMPLTEEWNGNNGCIDRLYLAVIIHKFFCGYQAKKDMLQSERAERKGLGEWSACG